VGDSRAGERRETIAKTGNESQCKGSKEGEWRCHRGDRREKTSVFVDQKSYMKRRRFLKQKKRGGGKKNDVLSHESEKRGDEAGGTVKVRRSFWGDWSRRSVNRLTAANVKKGEHFGPKKNLVAARQGFANAMRGVSGEGDVGKYPYSRVLKKRMLQRNGLL